MLNQDVFKGKWKQIKGEAKQWWGKLTDDDLAQVDGNVDTLVGRLQERYGYAKEDAEKEVNRRLQTYDSGTNPRTRP